MPRLLLLALFVFSVRPLVSVTAQDSPPAALVARYRTHLLRTMQTAARPDAVDSLAVLLADSLVLEYPVTRGRIVGREPLLASIRSMLGHLRNARLVVRHQLVTPMAVAAIEEVNVEDHREDRWQQRSRTQLVLYEIADGRIRRIIEYWMPTSDRP